MSEQIHLRTEKSKNTPLGRIVVCQEIIDGALRSTTIQKEQAVNDIAQASHAALRGLGRATGRRASAKNRKKSTSRNPLLKDDSVAKFLKRHADLVEIDGTTHPLWGKFVDSIDGYPASVDDEGVPNFDNWYEYIRDEESSQVGISTSRLPKRPSEPFSVTFIRRP